VTTLLGLHYLPTGDSSSALGTSCHSATEKLEVRKVSSEMEQKDDNCCCWLSQNKKERCLGCLKFGKLCWNWAQIRQTLLIINGEKKFFFSAFIR
jgi:hypothetical protein